MTAELKRAIEVLKDYRKGDFVDDNKFCEAIDTVVAEVETKTYTAEDMQSFFSWAINNGWFYGELTELWYNDEEEIEVFSIEDVLKLWEEKTK